MMKELTVLQRLSRTAPLPPFDPTKINVSELPDAMRPKHCCITADGNVASIDWITQEAWSKLDLRKFYAAITAAYARNGCSGYVELAIHDRDNTMRANATLIIKGGDYASKNNSQTSREAARKSTPAPEKNGGDGNCESKKIRVKQRLEWSVNTPDLLKDIIPNMRASESISPSIITIFGSLLAEVAKRATELHDPKLDSLMLRLNLYECEGADGDARNKWRVKMIDKLEQMAAKKEAPVPGGFLGTAPSRRVQ